MKKIKFRSISILLATSCLLTGCASNNQENNYKNKTIIPTETIEENTEIEEQTIGEAISDEEVIQYINKVGDEINNCTDGITESAKEGFITVVDFLFYGGEIGGRTFDSLKEDTKVKVLEIYDSLSAYLDEKLPIWKESLGEKYEAVKTYWDENKDDLFNALESGKQKIKSWYEEFRDKNQN